MADRVTDERPMPAGGWARPRGNGAGVRRGLGLPAAAAALILACACAPRSDSMATTAVHPEYDSVAPRSVAVLPFDNMSADLDATPLMRPIVAERLRCRGYEVPPLATVDEVLHEAGVLISHDVYAFEPGELGELLGVDAVMFGTVTDYATKYAGLYASVAVQLRLELVACENGDVLWQNEQRASRNTALESILTLIMYHDDLEKGLAVVATSNALFALLENIRPYGEEAAKKTLAPLPPGPRGQGTYPWDQDPAAFEKSSSKTIIYQSVILTAPP